MEPLQSHAGRTPTVSRSDWLSRLRGVAMIVHVPFTSDNRVNLEEYERLLEFQIQSGVRLLQCPQVDELFYLSVDERREVTSTLVRVSKGRALSINIVSYLPSTADTLRIARESEAQGFDLIKVQSPVHFSVDLNSEDLYRYFSTIITSVGIPTVIYNNPKRNGINLSSDLVLRLATDFESVVMVEESNFAQVMNLTAQGREKINVFSKYPYYLPTLALGGAGFYSSATYCPAQVVELYSLCSAGEFVAARELSHRYHDLFQLHQIIPAPTSTKYCLHLLGFEAGGARPPYPALPPEPVRSRIRDTLERHGLIGYCAR